MISFLLFHDLGDAFCSLGKELDAESHWKCGLNIMGHAHEGSPLKLFNIVDHLTNPNHIAHRLNANNGNFQFDANQFKGMSKDTVSNLKKF